MSLEKRSDGELGLLGYGRHGSMEVAVHAELQTERLSVQLSWPTATVQLDVDGMQSLEATLEFLERSPLGYESLRFGFCRGGAVDFELRRDQREPDRVWLAIQTHQHALLALFSLADDLLRSFKAAWAEALEDARSKE